MRAAIVILTSLLVPLGAAAQEQRTWVSATLGTDAAPCTRTQPCRTFQRAVDVTVAGGAVSVLTPGEYGPVLITKALTLDAGETRAAITVSDTSGVLVNAGTQDDVVLRGLDIAGGGTGIDGIRYLGGASLLVEDCRIHGFSGDGVEANLMAAGALTMRRTRITGSSAGIQTSATVPLRVVIQDTGIEGGIEGVRVGNNASILIEGSSITHAAARGIDLEASGTRVTLLRSRLTLNNEAVGLVASSTLVVGDSIVVSNGTGLVPGPGTISSFGNNLVAGNTVDGPTPAIIPTR